MTTILVGIDGTVRGERALAWALAQANFVTDPQLHLLTVVDPHALRGTGVSETDATQAAENLIASVQRTAAESNPDLGITASVTRGGIVDALVDAADQSDLIVLGSHHGASFGEAVGGAKGLRVSVSTNVPTAVIPSDWTPSAADHAESGIVVGVGPDNVSEKAVEFGVTQALATDQPLELVSVWGLPPVISRPAEAMGGGLAPVGRQFQEQLDARALQLRTKNEDLDVTGRSIEGAPASQLTAAAAGRRMLVLGTHSRTVLGRALFGSVSHGVLLDLRVPTVVVPNV
ncbi:universal stress protein [Pseudoclavibacter sp. CFCC 13611]|uniref:universal stress protein n=1 Tax=Pseudoclavibacter sp. CFCC 13611 TaxID=2615178 RepID=UPI001300ED44|nr:universal stress protein [Pseudoclavibacter sp. CFCC 13611]KAB1664098.1 universal stress protein [Pseudoclavibacter sp. CFCC 13611]